MLGMAIISMWQLLSGPERHQTLWHVPNGSYLALALVGLLGCLSSLAAALQADSWTAAAFELFGALLLAAVLGVDLWSIVTTTHYPDTDLVAGLVGGFLLGLIARIFLISKDAILVVKDQRAPPVGDLDLLAAGRVDSATALVVGSQSIGAHAAELKAVEAKHRAPEEQL
jgi:uncharacterized membrane protein YkvI